MLVGPNLIISICIKPNKNENNNSLNLLFYCGRLSIFESFGQKDLKSTLSCNYNGTQIL